MRLINDLGLNPVIFRALHKDGYNAGKSDATATSLIKPPQVRVLEKRHWQDLVVGVSKRRGAFIGTIIHKILELGEAPNCIKERRLFAEVEGWTVSAQFDLLTLDQAKLTDWKTMLAWKYMQPGAKAEFEQQLNMQAWLLAYGHDEHGNRVAYNVEQVEACPIIIDWSAKKAKLDPEYPQSWAPAMSFPLWPLAKTEAWIRERVRLHQAAEALPDDQLPECSENERWAKPATYAVMRKGQKNAVRGGLHGSQAQAQAFVEANGGDKAGLYIQKRESESTRCEDWCPAKVFCAQYRRSVPQGLEDFR